MLFNQNAQISKLKEKQKELIQKLSIKEYEERDEGNKYCGTTLAVLYF